MINYELKDIDPEDIEDLLVKIEQSFDIKFEGNELVHAKTFGQLCDHITNKIQLLNSADCTTQQAFYKLQINQRSQTGMTKRSIACEAIS